MKSIVVDDEPFALELTTGYVKKTPFLELTGTFTNPFKALSFLMANEVDLVFLDINMPELSGMQLLNSLPHKPMVIFTTAYPEFGAESYEFNAVDYLLKPINYVRFLTAVNKAMGILNLKKANKPTHSDQPASFPEQQYVFVKSGTQTHKLKVDDILYIEAGGNYMTFHLPKSKLLSLLTMAEVLELLPEGKFARVHKSYVVSLQHLNVIERHQVVVDGRPVPIGLTYREQFLEKAGRK
jgi:two-component system, LytTR family, response regulator